MPKIKNEDKLKYILISIHFILTFLFERLFLTDRYADLVTGDQTNSYLISFSAEKVLSYIIAKFFALCIIYLFYTVIFSAVSGKIKKTTLAVFIPVFLLRFTLDIIFLDTIFSQEYDNYIVLTYAISNVPYYWHHIYTSALYEGALMFFPNVIVIPFLHSFFFVSILAYIFEKLSHISYKLRIAGVLILLLLPKTDVLSSNPYRNCLYTMLCMFYFAYLLSSRSDEKHKATAYEKIFITLLSAFVSVWRSEGFVLGFFGLMYYCIFIDDGILWFKKKSSKKFLNTTAVLSVFLCLFFVLSLPQKLGIKKYSGSDYIFTSLIPITSYVLDSPYFDASYQAANYDLYAIDKICPIPLIQEKALGGYWEYNLSCGRDLTASAATPQEAAAFKKAVASLIIHNPKPFILSRIEVILVSINSPFTLPDVFSAQSLVAPEAWKQNIIKHMDSFTSSPLVMPLFNNVHRQHAMTVLVKMLGAYKNIWKTHGLDFAAFMLILLADIIMVLRGIFELFKKQFKNLHFTLLIGLFLGEFLLVAMTMPDTRSVYLMPFFYSSLVILAFYINSSIKRPMQKQ